MHNYLLPEAFNINDFQPYWAQFLIRPEFIESTYFLYEATKDEHYKEVAKQLIKSMKKYTRTPCGFAAVRDVRTGLQDDRMDSFVLSETLKYLYLLFTNKEDLIIDLNQFIFTTEAHFLPLTLSSIANKARFTNGTLSSSNDNIHNSQNENETISNSSRLRTCPNLNNLFKEQLERNNFSFFKNKSNKASKQPQINYYEKVRNGLKNYVELSNFEKMKYSPFSMQNFRDLNFNDNDNLSNQQEQLIDDIDLNTPIRLEPQDFTTTNSDHLKLLKSMGISLIQMSPKDPVQLIHLMSQADNIESGKEGIIFIKKMINLGKKQTLSFGNFVSFVKFNIETNERNLEVQLPACSSQFGIQLNKDEQLKFSAQTALVTPRHACNLNEIHSNNNVVDKFAIVERGECMFISKVRFVEKLGAIGVIIIDNTEDSSALTNPLFEMLGDQNNDVKIPVVLLYRTEADLLLDALRLNPNLIVHITNIVDETEEKPMLKLVSNLKEARILINEQLNKKITTQKESNTKVNEEEQSSFKKSKPKFNKNNEKVTLDEIKEDLMNLNDLIRDKMNNLLDNNQVKDGVKKLIDEYSKLKELALKKEKLEKLPNLIENIEPNLQDFLLTIKKMIRIESFDLSTTIDKPITEILDDLKLSDLVLEQLNQKIILKDKERKKSDFKNCPNLKLNAIKLRIYFSTNYWICPSLDL